jgi:uncharacterized RDD family membrane protein YckC
LQGKDLTIPAAPVFSAKPPSSRDDNVRNALFDEGLGTGTAGQGMQEGLASTPESRTGRDFGALSASPNQTSLTFSLKQEVNRRLAQHKSRNASTATEPHPLTEVQHGTSSRAAQAAARVAARYAKAPSYSEMQATTESVPVGFEAASGVEPTWEPEASVGNVQEQEWELTAQPAAPSSSQTPGTLQFEVRWEPDFPVRPAEPVAFRASHGTDGFDAPGQSWWEAAPSAQNTQGNEAIAPVEPAQPVHANLIEFPREIVAPRKVRPRMAEGPLAANGGLSGQLSIFEVDPGTVSTQPAMAPAAAEPAQVQWLAPEWSGIKLDAEPIEDAEPEIEPAKAAPALELAAMSRRLLAAVVDGTLIAGAFLAVALVAAAYIKNLPGIKEVEMGAAAALLIVGALYHAFFMTLADATPGMRYAYISLCTFDGHSPTLAQRCGRLGALLLSVAPLGLGVVWIIFDEDHLSWHDRLSRTYLRKC